MATDYDYTISVDFGATEPNLSQFYQEILDDVTIVKTLNNVQRNPKDTTDKIRVTFAAALSAGEKTALDTLVTNHVPVFPTGKLFVANETTGGTDVSSGFTAIPWITEVTKDSLYTHSASSSDVTINLNGSYSIHSDVTCDVTTGAKSDSVIRLMKDTGSGFTEITGNRSYAHHNNPSQGVATASIATTASLIAGNKIRIEGMKNNGSGTVKTVANGSRIQIQLLNTE